MAGLLIGLAVGRVFVESPPLFPLYVKSGIHGSIEFTLTQVLVSCTTRRLQTPSDCLQHEWCLPCFLIKLNHNLPSHKLPLSHSFWGWGVEFRDPSWTAAICPPPKKGGANLQFACGRGFPLLQITLRSTEFAPKIWSFPRLVRVIPNIGVRFFPHASKAISLWFVNLFLIMTVLDDGRSNHMTVINHTLAKNSFCGLKHTRV